jgi:hypothetical protein
LLAYDFISSVSLGVRGHHSGIRVIDKISLGHGGPVSNGSVASGYIK